MPCLYADTPYLGEILSILPKMPSHNWLISDLDCFDHCGWDGCEKWAEQSLFLTDAELRRDVGLRNMQFIWGVFSDIPAKYTQAEINRYPLPESQTPYYMSNSILPQHPLAELEFYVFDGDFTLINAREADRLAPLERLSCETHDEEAANKAMNAQLRRIQDLLRKEVPNVTPEMANEVQWNVWHSQFRGQSDAVEDAELLPAVMAAYRKVTLSPPTFRYSVWDPYKQE